jgi:hypothetical protein
MVTTDAYVELALEWVINGEKLDEGKGPANHIFNDAERREMMSRGTVSPRRLESRTSAP